MLMTQFQGFYLLRVNEFKTVIRIAQLQEITQSYLLPFFCPKRLMYKGKLGFFLKKFLPSHKGVNLLASYSG